MRDHTVLHWRAVLPFGALDQVLATALRDKSCHNVLRELDTEVETDSLGIAMLPPSCVAYPQGNFLSPGTPLRVCRWCPRPASVWDLHLHDQRVCG